jgi:hypothetical protein
MEFHERLKLLAVTLHRSEASNAAGLLLYKLKCIYGNLRHSVHSAFSN